MSKMNKLFCILLPLFFLACAYKVPPKFTATESICLANAEIFFELSVSSCGKNVEGSCSSESLVNNWEKASLKCLDTH